MGAAESAMNNNFSTVEVTPPVTEAPPPVVTAPVVPEAAMIPTDTFVHDLQRPIGVSSVPVSSSLAGSFQTLDVPVPMDPFQNTAPQTLTDMDTFTMTVPEAKVYTDTKRTRAYDNESDEIEMITSGY